MKLHFLTHSELPITSFSFVQSSFLELKMGEYLVSHKSQADTKTQSTAANTFLWSKTFQVVHILLGNINISIKYASENSKSYFIKQYFKIL